LASATNEGGFGGGGHSLYFLWGFEKEAGERWYFNDEKPPFPKTLSEKTRDQGI